jgi:hypothetical protein
MKQEMADKKIPRGGRAGYMKGAVSKSHETGFNIEDIVSDQSLGLKLRKYQISRFQFL